jgi:hypothetical protein
MTVTEMWERPMVALAARRVSEEQRQVLREAHIQDDDKAHPVVALGSVACQTWWQLTC